MAGDELQVAKELRTGVDRLIRQVGHWDAARWHGRAELVRRLLQQLADAAADASGQPRRVVPRLADTVLPDQLRVLAGELSEADAEAQVLSDAVAAISAVRRELDRGHVLS